MDLFVMSGQSNMQGQSECFAPYEAGAEAGYEYKRLPDALLPIRHPSGEDIFDGDNNALLLGAHQGFSSPLPHFARGYFETSGQPACYVHAAKGATTVAEWRKGTARYDALVNKTRAALSCLSRNGVPVGKRHFVWLQGESDGIEGVPEDVYRARLLAFWADIQRDLSLDACMIIRIARFYDFPCEPIMRAQEALCAERPDFVMLTRMAGSFTVANGLMQDQTAPFHYTNAGYRLLGETAGRNAALFLAGKPFDAGAERCLS